jgi:Uma2 family endonuclease
MASLQAEVTLPTGSLPGELYRISLDVYREMGNLGLLAPSDRVELLDGLLVKKMTRGPRHVTVTHHIVRYRDAHLPAGWHSRKEAPIELPGGHEGDSSPEPDVAVIAGALDNYSDRHPLAADIALVIEVASCPEMLARERKALARYAWPGLAVVWIVNLTNDTVEVYTNPSGPGPDPHYGTCAVIGLGMDLAIVLGGETVRIPVDAIMS